MKGRSNSIAVRAMSLATSATGAMACARNSQSDSLCREVEAAAARNDRYDGSRGNHRHDGINLGHVCRVVCHPLADRMAIFGHHQRVQQNPELVKWSLPEADGVRLEPLPVDSVCDLTVFGRIDLPYPIQELCVLPPVRRGAGIPLGRTLGRLISCS